LVKEASPNWISVVKGTIIGNKQKIV